MIHDSADKSEQYGLRLGCYGWLHEHWCNSFYPEDLPEDWQLGFYANEFPAVLVPAAYWQSDRGFDAESWRDDVDDRFRFYIEWPEGLDQKEQQQCLQQCHALGECLAGIIVHSSLQLPTSIPVYYSHSRCAAEQQLWSVAHSGRSGIALLSLAEKDLRVQRKYLEQFAASTDHLKAVLITDMEPDIESLRQIKILIELLGL